MTNHRQALLRRLGAGVLCLTLAFSSVGCYGSFGLVRSVHEFNGDISDNAWIQELVFLGFIWLPVYSLASLGDAIIFNSVEFWTGDNPIGDYEGEGEGEMSKIIETEDGDAVLTKLDDENIRVDVTKKCGAQESFVLVKTEKGVCAKSCDGTVLASVKSDEGEPELVE